ncbi:pimeloyl-ACP methyl ester carboxylesterase [Desulfobotulus alkaliphilus]|uniref:Pimeloyl-ACP methyl ester carboxylesterase n=1 Tax=Desulfobotulus alkaliphilus TaxID=622671 RepID=A0A562RRU3_9BACT|nr:alpha/beta hydrolase [Desulfobotulus alkaliphilus]TWI71831.1 pimeloyl-ACP methyl ester carboxylesterase [Desulfobotulus alkaliphilus]
MHEETLHFQSRWIASRQGELHTLQSKNSGKEPLFFVHGNSLCAAACLPLLEKLHQAGHPVLAADIRGHGLSTEDGSLPLRNWDIFIHDIALILKETQTKPVTAIGHSMGGYFLYAAAARFPELFSRIILLDPVIFPPGHIFLFRLTQALKLKNWFSLPRNTRKKRRLFPNKESAASHYRGKGMFRFWTEDSLQGFLDQGLKPAEEGGLRLSCQPELEARFYESVPTDTWKHAPAIGCPVHIIRAETSHLFAPEAASRLKKKIPLCEIHGMENAGHFFPLENPEGTADIILQRCLKPSSHEQRISL